MDFITRKQYMNQYGDLSEEERTRLHRNYYSQFVTDRIKSAVARTFGVSTLVASFKKDPFLNNLALLRWDALAYVVQCRAEMEKRGDFLTLAGQVCILKEAARMIVEENENAKETD